MKTINYYYYYYHNFNCFSLLTLLHLHNLPLILIMYLNILLILHFSNTIITIINYYIPKFLLIIHPHFFLLEFHYNSLALNIGWIKIDFLIDTIKKIISKAKK